MFKWLAHCPYFEAADTGSGGGDDLDILGDIGDSGKPDDSDADKPDTDKPDADKDDDEPLRDDNGNLVNEDGHLVNEDGELVNEDGELVDENDEVIKPDDDDADADKDDPEDRITHASDLKKAYPDIFKKFPDVKAALYRDQAYSEILGSPKEAEALVAKGNLLDQIEKDLVIDGNPKELLSAVKKDSAESYKKIAYAILPYLQENDKEIYLEVAALPIKQLLRSMAGKYGKETNEYKAALYVHQYFFDNLDLGGKTPVEEGVGTKKTAKEEEYEKKIAAIDQRDYDNFANGTNQSYITRVSKEFRATIENDDRLTEWMKSKLVENGLAEIKAQLDKDPRFGRQMKSLWSQAKSSGYSNDLKSRIVSTALARAKSLVPTVRAKLLAEALGKKKKPEEKNSGDKPNVRKFERARETVRRPNNEPKKALTDIDILRGRA
jgi:hypothetical protein